MAAVTWPRSLILSAAGRVVYQVKCDETFEDVLATELRQCRRILEQSRLAWSSKSHPP